LITMLVMMTMMIPATISDMNIDDIIQKWA